MTRRDGEADRLSPTELHRCAEAVAELSGALNHDRDVVHSTYLDDAERLLAYVSFFMPRSFAQFTSVIGELEERPNRVLDLGSGPGPGALAAIEAGAESVLAVDHSASALRFLDELAPEVSTESGDLETIDAGALVRRFQPDLVLIGHAINEIFAGADGVERRADLLAEILDALPSGGRLVTIDPALRTTSRALISVRDRLAERGYSIFAPCLRLGPCPALDDERDWCHAERPWFPPIHVREIAELVGIRHDVFKMTYFIFGPPDEKWSLPDGRIFRIVSEPLHTKGRLRYFGCGEEGRFPLVMKERDAVDDAQDFSNLRRGDVVRIGETVTKGDGEMVVRGEIARKIGSAGEPAPGEEE